MSAVKTVARELRSGDSVRFHLRGGGKTWVPVIRVLAGATSIEVLVGGATDADYRILAPGRPVVRRERAGERA